MKIDFLAHASFLFTDTLGHTFMTDPYESGGFSGRVGYAPIDISPDVIIITHDHLDHSHTETIPGDFQVIRHEGEALNVAVREVPVFHDMQEGTRFGGTVDMKIFTIDGMTIGHCGDIGELLDEDKVNAIGALDILIIPTGGYYTLGPWGAAQVVEKLKPKIVIPCHYKTDHCGFDIKPVEPFLEYFENVIEAKTSVFELAAHQLPMPTSCLVLPMRYDVDHPGFLAQTA